MTEWEARTAIHMLRDLENAQVEKIMDDQGGKYVRLFLQAKGSAEYSERQRPGTLGNVLEVSLTPDEAVRIGRGLLEAGQEALGTAH